MYDCSFTHAWVCDCRRSASLSAFEYHDICTQDATVKMLATEQQPPKICNLAVHYHATKYHETYENAHHHGVMITP